MALRFLAEACLGELGISHHEVAGDEGHLHAGLPLGVELFTGAFFSCAIPVLAFLAVGFDPFHGLVEFGFVEDAAFDAADEFGHVHRLDAHAEPLLEERGINDRTSDAHGCAAHGQVSTATHGRCGEAGAGEAQEFLFDIGRNGVVTRILHVPAIDTESGQSLLGVRGKHGGEIDSAWALSAIESPDRFGCEWVGIHRLGAVAPAGCDCERNSHILAAEFIGASGCFADAADAGIGNHTLHGLAGRVAKFGGQKRGRVLGHGHGLFFEGFANAAEAAIDGRTDADFREISHRWSFSVFSFKNRSGAVGGKQIICNLLRALCVLCGQINFVWAGL